jgi:hypothetical protein
MMAAAGSAAHAWGVQRGLHAWASSVVVLLLAVHFLGDRPAWACPPNVWHQYVHTPAWLCIICCCVCTIRRPCARACWLQQVQW